MWASRRAMFVAFELWYFTSNSFCKLRMRFSPTSCTNNLAKSGTLSP